jgi:hypothetical protein
MLDRKTLINLHSLSDEIKQVSEQASELLRTAQDRFNHVEHDVVRSGKKVKITEKALWEEVWYLGNGCEAAKILGEKHPEVFDAFKKQNAKAADLKKFSMAELGVNFEQLTISDYLRLTEELFGLLISEKEGKPAFTMEIEKTNNSQEEQKA